MVVGAVGVEDPMMSGSTTVGPRRDAVHNSALLVNPSGDVVGRYDKIHLVPFGEYVPFQQLFSFAEALTKEVGTFEPGTSRQPLRRGMRDWEYSSVTSRCFRMKCGCSRQTERRYCEHFERRVVWRQRRVGAALTAGADAAWRTIAGSCELRTQERRRRLIPSGGWWLRSAQDPRTPRSALRLGGGNYFLHASRRLVRIPVCDNFVSRAGGYGVYARSENLMTANTMIEELDRNMLL